jgi:hypothetical protein
LRPARQYFDPDLDQGGNPNIVLRPPREFVDQDCGIGERVSTVHHRHDGRRDVHPVEPALITGA